MVNINDSRIVKYLDKQDHKILRKADHGNGFILPGSKHQYEGQGIFLPHGDGFIDMISSLGRNIANNIGLIKSGAEAIGSIGSAGKNIVEAVKMSKEAHTVRSIPDEAAAVNTDKNVNYYDEMIKNRKKGSGFRLAE